ncbi:MAG: aldehyde dehydrogenase family protein [Sphingobacteriaceae bacterium]
MKNLIQSQRDFFNSNQTKSIDFRITQLLKLRKLLQANEQILNEAIFADFQKSAFDTYTNELSILYAEIDESVRKVKNWASRKRVATNLVNLPAKSYIVPEPLGVCLIIGAWNYPYQLSFGPAIAAIAAGNTVILKPSELPIRTSQVMAKMINENFDPAFFKVVEGGIPETNTLLAERFDKIFFTGSVGVGKIVYQAAAKYLTPVTLELGGKSPAIITDAANLKLHVKRIVWAKFINAGQTCIAPDYILLPKSLEQEFLTLAKAEIANEQFAVANDNYVQIINSKNLQRLAELIDPAKVFCGGGFNEQTRVFEPTIMQQVSFDDKIMQEEIFGPILPVITYENLDEAISEIKKREKPLSCYVFTSSTTLKNKIINELSFGSGAINECIMQITNSNMPFGGVGESGIGAYHGEFGFKTFSHFKSMLEKPSWFEPNLKYYPRTKFKFNLIKFLMRLS